MPETSKVMGFALNFLENSTQSHASFTVMLCLLNFFLRFNVLKVLIIILSLILSLSSYSSCHPPVTLCHPQTGCKPFVAGHLSPCHPILRFFSMESFFLRIKRILRIILSKEFRNLGFFHCASIP